MNSAPDYLTKGLAILSERGKQYGSNDKERSFPQVARHSMLLPDTTSPQQMSA